MDDMCTGCLSTDRKLFFIGETGYYHLYSQILNEIPVYDLSQICVRVCWECRARLRTMQLFRQQVKQNYSDLMQQIPPQATSVLSCHSLASHSYPEVREEKVVVKCEAVEHCEPEPFASALSISQHVEPHADEQTKQIPPQATSVLSCHSLASHSYPEVREEKVVVKCEAVEHCEPEPFASALSISQHVEPHADEQTKPPKKKKPKVKIKVNVKKKNYKKRTRNAIHFEKDKLKGETHDIESKDIEDIDTNIDDIDDNIEENEDMVNGKIDLKESELENLTKSETKARKMNEEKVEKVSNGVKVRRTRSPAALPDRPQCDECGKVFSSKKTYRYHLNVLHKGQNQYPCPRCGKVYQWKSNLGRHMRSHRAVDDGELHCALCDKSFASVATYRQHLRISRRHVPETDFSFACDACGKRFVNKTRLRDHVDWEHLNRIKFRCQHCNKPFKCHTSLYVHTQNVHVGKERKENLCHVCGKSYQNAAKLKYHITAMHSGETPYRCAACGAAFGWYSSLYRHMREVHHKLKGVPKKGKKLKQARVSPAPAPLYASL